MKYEFPVIHGIKQVRDAIADSTEFFESDKGEYIVFNYRTNMEDTFPPITNEKSKILRECRGIIFDKTGKLLSRRYHKFMNLNEREETNIGNIDFSKPHIVLQKLDGSMITPLKINNEIHWASKMGITDVGLMVSEFVANSPIDYIDFARFCTNFNYTPIFEFCSRKQRIVVDYPTDIMILTAIRYNNTGYYIGYKTMCDIAELFGIPVVKAFDPIDNPGEFLAMTRELNGEEGFVVRFDDGHMVKVKSDWYCRIHKAKDTLNFEKNVLRAIVTDSADDLKSVLFGDDRIRFDAYHRAVYNGIEASACRIYDNLIHDHLICNGDRKTFAITRATNYHSLDRSIMFRLWDKLELHDKNVISSMICDTIKKACCRESRVDDVRDFFNASWKENCYAESA